MQCYPHQRRTWRLAYFGFVFLILEHRISWTAPKTNIIKRQTTDTVSQNTQYNLKDASIVVKILEDKTIGVPNTSIIGKK